jgi:predicted DNA-binding protein
VIEETNTGDRIGISIASIAPQVHEGLSLMTTTTIRIDDDLKARVAAAAEQAGKTAHAFILDAIVRTVEQVELDEAFHRVADRHWAN